MADEIRSQKFLTSAEQIKHYMGIQEILYQHFLRLKLPVTIINNRHYAHADNLDDWWRDRTRTQQVICLEKPCQE